MWHHYQRFLLNIRLVGQEESIQKSVTVMELVMECCLLGITKDAQDSFFYGSVFNKHLTMCLLNFLVKESNEGNWVWNESNMLCVVAAQQRLNTVFGTNFSIATIHKRVRLLKNRWNTFNDMLQMSGVNWDSGTNMMRVPAVLWTTTLMSNRLARAYQYEGDPQYDLLQTLFNDPGPGVAGEILPVMDPDDVEEEDEALPVMDPDDVEQEDEAPDSGSDG
ncbi:hypothetical protein ACS0TY_001979 [Phlomoides rotata]